MQAELSTTSLTNTDTKELSSSSTKTAKLPKLVISRFGGSFTEWPKFWGHFTEAIDKSSIAAITKFTYLLELLEPNVKLSETGPIDDISTLRISTLKYFMIDDSKRLDQNDLYNRNLRARETIRHERHVARLLVAILYYTFLKPFL